MTNASSILSLIVRFIISLETGSSNNRLFIILAVALVGLICIGLVGLSGVLFLSGNGGDDSVSLPPTATPFPPTFTPTLTPTPTPTDTPAPTNTPTAVVENIDPAAQQETTAQADPTDTPTVDPAASPTNTPVLRTPTVEPTEEPTPAPEIVPASGGTLSQGPPSFLLWAGGLVLMLLVIYGSFSRFRSSAPPHR